MQSHVVVNGERVERDKTLWYLNATMSILHLVLAVSILIVACTIGAPYMIRFESFWGKVDFNSIMMQRLNNATCGGIDYVAQDKSVFDWFACLRETYGNMDITQDENKARLYVVEPHELFSFELWILLFLFELVTAAFHCFLLFSNTYDWFVKRELQPFRWIEYSFTSSIMLWAVMALSRISEVYSMFGFFIGSVFLELTGGL